MKPLLDGGRTRISPQLKALESSELRPRLVMTGIKVTEYALGPHPDMNGNGDIHRGVKADIHHRADKLLNG